MTTAFPGLLFLAGVAVLLFGVAMCSVAGALICAGLMLMGLAVACAWMLDRVPVPAPQEAEKT